jgi:serine/threonine protein kinase
MSIDFPIEVSPEAENLIKRMLVIKPEDRISFPELFIHPWLKDIIGPDGLPLEGQGEEHDNHDFQMSLSF